MVEAAQSVYSTATAVDGTYSIGDAHTVPGLEYTLSARATGYITRQAAGSIDVPGQALPMDLPLTPVPALSVAVTTPEDQSQVNMPVVTVTGTLSHPAAVTVNGYGAAVTGTTFTATIPVVEGSNTITALAQDPYYQNATAQTRVNLVYVEPTCAFAVSDADIAQGESVTLSWSTDNATDIRIDPGIGPVPASGTLIVAPAMKTTYILTAANPHYSTSAEATVALDQSAPVLFKADPIILSMGQEATLQWSCSSDYADTITIGSGIGPVASHGSLRVSLSEPVTYTLTATGSAGVATAQASVSIHLPTVKFISDTTAIQPGGHASLHWSAADATGCTIEPGIGPVDFSGTLVVFPTHSTAYSLIAIGPGGTTTESVLVAVASDNALQITEPYDSAWIERPDVLVQGTFANTTGKETGITVNGVQALVYGNRFAANHIPLQEGANAITVRAVDVDGQATETSILVQCRISGHFIRLDTVPAAGTPGFEAAFTVDGSFEFQQATLDSDYIFYPIHLGGNRASDSVTMNSAGLHFFEAEAQDQDGLLHTDEVAVLVYDRNALDSLLQAKWSAMKARLTAGDIDGALNYYSNTSRDDYRAIFTALGAQLPQVVQEMQAIEMIYAEEGFAKYRIRRNEIHQGQQYSITYHIYFDCNEDGIWRIHRF